MENENFESFAADDNDPYEWTTELGYSPPQNIIDVPETRGYCASSLHEAQWRQWSFDRKNEMVRRHFSPREGVARADGRSEGGNSPEEDTNEEGDGEY